jgi:hypothetical protein
MHLADNTIFKIIVWYRIITAQLLLIAEYYMEELFMSRQILKS